MSQNDPSPLSQSDSSSMNVDLSETSSPPQPPPPPPSTPVSSKLFSNPSSSKSRPSKPPPPPPSSSLNPRVISKVDSSKPGSSSMEPNHQRCFLAVSGMSCSSCVKGIESTLLRQSGIYEVKVALISNSAEVVYDPLVISPEEIITILDGLGFDSKITSTSDSCNESELVVEIGEERDTNGNKLNANHQNGGLAKWLLIEQELCRLIGVKSVKIDRTTMQITIFYFKEQIGPRTIVQTVAGQLKPGYQVRVVEFDAMQQSLKLMRADVRKWRQSFLISLLFTVPTVVAMIYFMHNEMAPPSPKQLHHSNDRKTLQSSAELLLPGLNLKNLIFFLLATPVQLYTSRHFYLQSYRSIVLMHRANMDVLIAMATTVAYGYSVLIVVYAMICQYQFSPDTFFDTPPMMITFISLGRYIEHRTRLSATEALFQLCNSTPTDATLVHIESKTDTPTTTTADPKNSYTIIKEESISVSLIETGDYLRVLPEQIIPVDGQVFDGQSRVCESLITGEPGEIVKLPGSILYGGSINRSGTILMRATGVGRDTTIAQIYKLIQEAQTTKPEVQKFADQIAGWFVPTVAALSASVFGIWLIVGHYFLKEIALIYPITSLSMTSTELVTQFAVLCAVNVLIISCPCALGIATPTAVAAASAIGLKLGLLIKGAIPLEQAGRIKYALIDKTGTLTEGKPTVTGMKLLNRIGPKSGNLEIETESPDKTTGLLLQKLFALIGIAETSSTHPIAYSVLNYVRQSLRMTPDSSFGVCSKFKLHTGMGVHCIVDASQLRLFIESINTGDSQYWTIDGEGSTKISYAENVGKNSAVTLDERWFETAKSFSVLIGNKQLMNKYGIELGDDTEREMQRLEIKGETVFLVAINSMLIGMISVADQIKENAALAVYTLKKKYGVQVIMLTGDNATSAWKVAKQVGINKVYAELLPAHKLQKIGELQEGGKTVAMIGDGLNDAPALQKANVGIAFALGNQIALNSAGIILVRNDILDVVVALHLARKTTTRIFSNLLLAFIYNCIMIPAAGGLYFVFFGGMLRPWVSSLLMVLSSLSVVSNSLLLRKLYRKPTKQSLETEEFRRLYAMLRKTQYTNSSEIPTVHSQNGSGIGAATTTAAGNYLKLDSSVSLMSLHGLGNLQEGTGVQNPEDIDRSRQKEIWAKVKNPSLDSNDSEDEDVSNARLFIETIEASNNALGHRPNSNLILQKNNENNQQSFGPNNV